MPRAQVAFARPEPQEPVVVATPPAEAPPKLPCAQIDSYSGDPNFMMSLARGLLVIQAFTQKKRQMTISQLSAKTGMSRAAVRRCLYTLAQLGFAESEDGRHFYLGPRILALGYSYIASMPLATAAQPVLERVSHELHESCSISTLDHNEIIYVARASVTRIMSIDLGVGSRLPAFCTSMGRVLLANLQPDELERYLSQTPNEAVHGSHGDFRGKTAAGLATGRTERLRDRGSGTGVGTAIDGGADPESDGENGSGTERRARTRRRVSIQEMQTRFLPRLRTAAQELSMLLR